MIKVVLNVVFAVKFRTLHYVNTTTSLIAGALGVNLF